MELTFRSPFSYGISNYSKRLSRNGLLIYLTRPNEDIETGEDTYIWGYILPDDAGIRAATGWVSGTANVFYTSTGAPTVALATEVDAVILPAKVVFSLISRDEYINRLFYEVDGIHYDHQDLTTLFQDAQGTLPVYRPGAGVVDPPVGLMLDKSHGVELGPELIPQPLDFADWVSVGTGTTASGGTIELLTDAGGGASLSAVLKAGKTYQMHVAGVTTAPNVRIRNANNYNGQLLISTPSFDATIISTNIWDGAQALYLQIGAVTGGSTTTITEFSIREIKGHHAYQATPTARPTLSGRYNLLTATETLTTQSVTTAATDYTLRFEGAGSIALSGTATGTLTAGTHTITCTAGTLTCTVDGTVTEADLRVKRDGSSLPAYQAVVDANTYDTAGFPLYLKRDKVDDDLIVQAPAITGQVAWGSIDTVTIAAATIAAGEYKPFGMITAGEPTCTQWIAIDGTLTAAEQVILELYVYSKSQLPVVPTPEPPAGTELTIDTIPLTINGQRIYLYY